MTGWLLLSDRDTPVADALPEATLPSGTLVIELSWPLPVGVLLDWRGGGDQTLSLFHHPATGIGLLWRDADGLRRLVLPGRLQLNGRVARLLFRWDRAGNSWSMRLDDGDQETIASTYGLNPPALSGLALARLCAGRGVTRRESSVLWFGVMQGAQPPARDAWIGISTPILTVEGHVPAGLLQPGQWVLTRDAGPQRLRAVRRMDMPSRGSHAAVVLRLRAVRRMDMPSRGSHAAVVLRAPYYGQHRDLLVSADQFVVIGGLEAEYLFGENEVLVTSGALVDGRAALADNRRATAAGVSLDLGGLHLLEADGCCLMSAFHGPASQRPLPPLRALMDYEALPLLSLLRRLKPSDAA